MNELMQ